MDRRLQALDGLRGSPYTSLWWQMESVTSLLGHPGYPRFTSLCGRWSHLQAFGGIRDRRVQGFCWRALIGVYMPLVAYVDRRL